jgi:trans-aconitate methyltransferase
MIVPTEKGFSDFAHFYYQEKIQYALKITQCSTGTVYELGCGRGEALSVFKEHGFAIKGFEMDTQCLAIAEKFLGQGVVSSKLLTSAIDLSEKADLVFSNHVLEHFTDLNDAFKGLQRLVKPGGFVVTIVPTVAQNRSFLGRAYLNAAHYSAFSHHSLTQLFAKYGFKTIHHTYRGWKKEIDEVWHIAQYRPELTLEPTLSYENPQKVSLDVNFFNPLRAIAFSPQYAYHAKRVWAMNFSKHMVRKIGLVV